MSTQKNPIGLKPLRTLQARTAVYARYSSDMQSADSAEDQILRIRYRLEMGQVQARKYFDRTLRLDDAWVVKDEAQSGRVAGREGYERILQGVRDKSFDVLNACASSFPAEGTGD